MYDITNYVLEFSLRFHNLIESSPKAHSIKDIAYIH